MDRIQQWPTSIFTKFQTCISEISQYLFDYCLASIIFQKKNTQFIYHLLAQCITYLQQEWEQKSHSHAYPQQISLKLLAHNLLRENSENKPTSPLAMGFRTIISKSSRKGLEFCPRKEEVEEKQTREKHFCFCMHFQGSQRF